MTTNPFTTPGAAGSGFRWSDHVGRLLVIKPKEFTTVNTTFGPAEAIRADVYVIDGEAEDYEDSLIFAAIVQGQLRRKIGEMVLGRAGQGHPQPGQSAPWVLNDPSPADMATAEAWLAARQQPKFTAPAAGDRPPF